MNARLDPSAAALQGYAPGRSRPLHYRYAPDSFARPSDVPASDFDGPQRRFGARQSDVFSDAIAIDTDAAQAQTRFLRQWAEGSDAHASYFQRIAQGPAYRVDDAIRIEE